MTKRTTEITSSHFWGRRFLFLFIKIFFFFSLFIFSVEFSYSWRFFSSSCCLSGLCLHIFSFHLRNRCWTKSVWSNRSSSKGYIPVSLKWESAFPNVATLLYVNDAYKKYTYTRTVPQRGKIQIYVDGLCNDHNLKFISYIFTTVW